MKSPKKRSSQSLRCVRVRDITLSYASLLLRGDTPIQTKARELLDLQQFSALLQLETPVSGYASAADFEKDYLASELLSKFPFDNLGIDRKQVALQKFSESEDQCRSTNIRLASCKNYDYTTTTILMDARRKIANLLGRFDWDEAERGFGFGPGSTTRLSRSRADLYYKLSGRPHSTPENIVAASAVLQFYSNWGAACGYPLLDHENIVVGNNVITVPKNAKTDRIIAKEPCLNIFVQKGIGAMIRRRLKKVGIDLDDQGPNQRLAFQGSVDGSLATLDLSAASDTVSIGIVETLLPVDWYEAMNSSRSHRGILPSGQVITYRKFSSMGNGFTFELESLIFWALCSAVSAYHKESDRRLAVYGDDIIVPTGLAGRLIDILSFCGFTTNRKKTHLDGPFRESCGKHYFRGCDVTPIYIREKIDTVSRSFWAANAAKRKARMHWGHDSFFKPAWDHAYENVPKSLRCKIPEGVGDGGFVVDFDEALPRRAPGVHSCGYQVRHVVFQPRRTSPEDEALYRVGLYRLDRRASATGAPTRCTCGTYAPQGALLAPWNAFRAASAPIGRWKPLGGMDGHTHRRAACAACGRAVSAQPPMAPDRRYILPGITHQDGVITVVRSVVWQWENYGPWLGS